MPFRLFSRDHNTYHRRFRNTWSQREKEAIRPFAFQPKAPETVKNQYKSELLPRSHPYGHTSTYEFQPMISEKISSEIFQD